MPTITIKNGNRTLKLSKREFDGIQTVAKICTDLKDNYGPLAEASTTALGALVAIVRHVEANMPANGKPSEPAAK